MFAVKNLFILSLLINSFLFSPAQVNYTQYVNPLVGTGGHGHTYPGAVMPHGMVQLSPDTRLEGWDGCSGYHYSDNYIYGFTHTHLSGTGCSDYGDILLMPMTGNPSPDNKVYGSAFTHANEKASPGYYSVKLDDDKENINYAASVYLGDLLVTCYSLYSRNRTFGNMIGKGYSVRSAQLELNMVAEGYNASRCIHATNQNLHVQLPIADCIYEILWQHLSAGEGFKKIETALV